MGCLQALKGLAQSTCETNLAGIKKVYIANYENVASVDVDYTGYTVESISMSGSTKFYAYNFAKQTGSLTSTLTKDETNGTRYYLNAIALQFNKMEAKKHLEISALAADAVAVIVLDNNGKMWYVGFDAYASATDGTIQSGQSFDDLNGYQLTLQAQSAYLPFEITDASILDNIVVEVDA